MAMRETCKVSVTLHMHKPFIYGAHCAQHGSLCCKAPLQTLTLKPSVLLNHFIR